MLTLSIPSREFFNESEGKFVTTEKRILELNHSLFAISRWESKWKKSFFKSTKKDDEVIDYIRCMAIEPIDFSLKETLTTDNYVEIEKYISDKSTATYFGKGNGKKNNETLTSEVVYYYMTVYNIPMEVQHWHLNRLLALLDVCARKSQPKKKMSKAEMRDHIANMDRINEQRKAALGTKG